MTPQKRLSYAQSLLNMAGEVCQKSSASLQIGFMIHEAARKKITLSDLGVSKADILAIGIIGAINDKNHSAMIDSMTRPFLFSMPEMPSESIERTSKRLNEAGLGKVSKRDIKTANYKVACIQHGKDPGDNIHRLVQRPSGLAA